MSRIKPSKIKLKPRIAISTGLFLVLLRVAIGWHFFYEGYWKMQSHEPGGHAFSSEPYLRASVGPFRDCFLALIQDADGIERLSDESVKEIIDQRFDQYVVYYDLDEDQKDALQKNRERYQKKATRLCYDEGFQRRLTDYKGMLNRVKADASVTEGLFSQERLKADRAKLDTIRTELLAEIQKPIQDFENKAISILDVEQRSQGPLPPRKSPTYYLDLAMTWGLILIGAGLIVGVFTRLCCLGGIGLLAMFYLSMPPWPGVPVPAMATGHAFIVNKNLIELLALVVLLTTRSGFWFGFDGFIRRFITGPLFGRGCRPAPVAEPSAPPLEPAVEARLQPSSFLGDRPKPSLPM